MYIILIYLLEVKGEDRVSLAYFDDPNTSASVDIPLSNGLWVYIPNIMP